MKSLYIVCAALVFISCQRTKFTEGEQPVIVYRQPTNTPPPVQPRPPGSSNSFVTLDRLEETILLDLSNITSSQERERTRYLIACDRANLGQSTDEFEMGINLALNGLSDERSLTKVTRIGAENCIYRFDLDDFTLTRTEWRLIESNSLIDFVSETTRNQNIQFLTQSLKPYIFGSDFAVVAYEADAVANKGGSVYYDLINQAELTGDFFLQQGIQVRLAVDAQDALFAGFSESLIALNKTRMLQVIESDNGYCLSTFDTALNGDDLYVNPFTIEVAFAGNVLNSERVFNHAAQEHLCTTSAGLLLYRLNNDRDLPEVVAPTDVVNNANQAFDTSIRIGDCGNCHYRGAIPFQDQIGQHILSNPAFNQSEKLLAQIFFRGDKITAVINEINKKHQRALDDLGVTAEVDPLTQVVMRPLREEMDANQIASFTFQSTEQFLQKLRGTQVSSQVFGALLVGGKVNLATLNANFATLVDEMNLFQDIEL